MESNAICKDINFVKICVSPRHEHDFLGVQHSKFASKSTKNQCKIGHEKWRRSKWTRKRFRIVFCCSRTPPGHLKTPYEQPKWCPNSPTSDQLPLFGHSWLHLERSGETFGRPGLHLEAFCSLFKGICATNSLHIASNAFYVCTGFRDCVTQVGNAHIFTDTCTQVSNSPRRDSRSVI